MEIDCASSTSNDSNPAQYASNIAQNYYSDNLYFPNTKRTEFEYFNKDYFTNEKKQEDKEKTFNKTNQKDFENMNNNNNNKSSDQFSKKGFVYSGGYSKKDYVETVKNNNMEYFNGKKTDSNCIHLNSVDGFGKKSMSFSADQVKRFTFFLNFQSTIYSFSKSCLFLCINIQ